MHPLPILYSFRRCPYAIRARLALAASGTPVELREVVLREKPAALLRASAKATVPVLVMTDGRILDESLSIMQWALARNDAWGWLYSGEPRLQSEAESLIKACDGGFKHALDRCKYPERYPHEDAERSWREALAWLQTLNDRLQGGGALCGTNMGLADAAIVPFVRQFAAIDPIRWNALLLPHLKRWKELWLDSALFAEVMTKHTPWREGAPLLKVFDGAQKPPNPQSPSVSAACGVPTTPAAR